ncbi:MarR family winged helix-turn-helix transcriptional regulator [Rhizobium skierniewicense]|uniref:MarR family winged helix-turn-helix transcriptional regulator n=1 Tax=Rhizobium skierniewicense TaxID=984260 RepID=UPI001572F127|nr:MarR family winged helix-turn-helix transcriptional regulator [Rhizobium skierniewicense]NTF34228.1 winged helix-turn-helix transcriptional regulator [Rhizobium skierniewicense]
MAFWDGARGGEAPPRIDDIYESPAHLIRRCQQISVSLFMEELGELDLTPIQYASLLAIRDQPDIDQRSLSKIIAIDRSTVGTVLRTLEVKGLIERAVPSDNQRIKTARISQEGERVLVDTSDRIAAVQRRLLKPLDVHDQKVFLSLLSKLVSVNNIHSRAPLDISRRNDFLKNQGTDD